MARSEAVDKKVEISAQKRKINNEENEEKREERRLVRVPRRGRFCVVSLRILQAKVESQRAMKEQHADITKMKVEQAEARSVAAAVVCRELPSFNLFMSADCSFC